MHKQCNGVQVYFQLPDIHNKLSLEVEVASSSCARFHRTPGSNNPLWEAIKSQPIAYDSSQLFIQCGTVNNQKLVRSKAHLSSSSP